MLVSDRPDLLKEGDKIARLCETLCERCMKAKNTNEVMGLKFHYLSHIFKFCVKNKDNLESGIKRYDCFDHISMYIVLNVLNLTGVLFQCSMF